MQNYTYRIQHKFCANPKLLEQFGFARYEEDGGDEVFYAVGVKLPWECSIADYMVKAFEKIYSKASPSERSEDFSQYSFSEGGKLEITDSVKDEFTRCQVCVAASGVGEWNLFINAPDRIEYYNTRVLDECVPELIGAMRAAKAIYKSKVAGKRKRGSKKGS